MGFVYLIEDSNSNTYKIGVSRSHPSKRIKKLQTGNSCKLNLRSLFETEYPFRLESILHNRFKMYQELNEWYNLPEDVVQRFNEICTELNDIIYLMKDNHFFQKNLK